MRPLPTNTQAAPRKAPMAQTPIAHSNDTIVESARAEHAHMPPRPCETGSGSPGNGNAAGYDPGDT
jgi:hypothetical protein